MVMVSVSLFAADSPLPNAGAPIHVPFACADDELQAAGLNCDEDNPCRILLELTAVDTSANRLFLTGNLHTTSATLASILLMTEDNGLTWREAYQRIPFAALDQIQFLDFQHGWISGENVLTVARDPFLLATADGGLTWRLLPVFAEEQQPGAIQRFRFDSPTTGTLLLDRGVGKRYELYRTATGGAAWELLKTDSGSLSLPAGPPPAVTAWRLRADAKTSSWLLEENHGEIWHRIAAFSTEVTVCR